MKIGATIALLLATTSAQAAEIERNPDGDTISITGFIERGDARKFDILAADMKSGGTVILDSMGGSLGDGIDIGRVVRTLKFATTVRDGAKCYSACSLIWLAGVRRELDPLGLVGLHSAQRVGSPTDERSDEGNALMADFMLEIGVPKAFANMALIAGPDWMTTLNHHQARSWGLLEELPSGSSDGVLPPSPHRRESAGDPRALRP